MHALIAYFSRSGENYVNGSIQNLEIGNTALAAKLLQELTGADLFQIESATAYSSHYSKCIDEAKADQRRNARPALKYCPENMAQYDTIYLGYPNYWGTMPMVVFTFLEQYDFSHKTIYPFCTHEGSGMGRSEADIRQLCPGAEIKPGLAIHGAQASRATPALAQWCGILEKTI